MPAPSVTNTFSNQTPADASAVNANFTDLINGVSDGTKDLSVSALTCAGTATLNGNVNIGNSSVDDLTITASLASSIPIKTTGTYNIGSATLGILGCYFGNASNSNTAGIIGGVTSGSYTVTLPLAAPSAGQRLVASSSSVTTFLPGDMQEITNVGLACSVATSALTIALKQADGSTDCSSTAPAYIRFGSSTATSGASSLRTVTGSLSLVISSGSTLGHASAVAQYIYVYALDNAGTVELGASSVIFDDGSLVSTTAEGGAGAADSNAVMYSSSARSNVRCRLIARLLSTQTTAGTWAAVPTEVSIMPFEYKNIFARYSTNAGQSIADNSPTIVNFEDKGFDSHNCVTTGASWKFTAPRTGKYRFDVHLGYAGATGWTLGDTVSIYIYIDGSFQFLVGYRYIYSSDATATSVPMDGGGGGSIVSMTAGQYLDFRALQTRGGATNLASLADYNHVSIHYLGT